MDERIIMPTPALDRLRKLAASGQLNSAPPLLQLLVQALLELQAQLQQENETTISGPAV
jgi:hypothetical protein